MMVLCIDGSDINTLTLEVYERNGQVHSDNAWRHVRGGVFTVRPEEYLATMTTLVDFDDLDGIVVVQGPGSATALRASLTIVNTLAMAKQIPLYGVDKGTPWDAVLTENGPKDGVTHLEPVYAQDARITPSKKDQLRRSI